MQVRGGPISKCLKLLQATVSDKCDLCTNTLVIDCAHLVPILSLATLPSQHIQIEKGPKHQPFQMWIQSWNLYDELRSCCVASRYHYTFGLVWNGGTKITRFHIYLYNSPPLKCKFDYNDCGCVLLRCAIVTSCRTSNLEIWWSIWDDISSKGHLIFLLYLPTIFKLNELCSTLFQYFILFILQLVMAKCTHMSRTMFFRIIFWMYSSCILITHAFLHLFCLYGSRYSILSVNFIQIRWKRDENLIKLRYNRISGDNEEVCRGYYPTI